MDIWSRPGNPAVWPNPDLPLESPFTYRMARTEAGLTQRNLTDLVVGGVLRRPIKGVYIAAQVPDSLELRCACLKLVSPPDAVVTDRHAGWLHGAGMVLRPNEHLDLAPVSMFLPPGRRLRNDLTDSGERTLRPDDVMEIGGLLVTTPLRTALDLGRNRWPDRSLSALDQMLRLGAFTKEELIAAVPRFRGTRWVRVLRIMVVYADARAESPGESVLRLRWIEALIETPVPQFEVWDGADFLARLDLANEKLRYGAEYDGVEWHSSPEQRRHDAERRAAVEERGGFVVDAFTKDNLFGRHQNADQLLRAGVERARRQLGGRPGSSRLV